MSDHKQIERYLAFAFGVIFVAAMLLLAILLPEPSRYQFLVYKIVLAIAVAGVAALIPGFIQVNVPPVVRAGGAIAVFVMIFFFNPAELVTQPRMTNSAEDHVLDLKHQVVSLRGAYEDERSTSAIKVADEAPPLANALARVPDSKLSLGHQIIKYRYIAYVLNMACDSESDAEQSQKYCENALQAGHTYTELVGKALTNSSGGKYHAALADWVRDERHEDRAHYQLALSTALLYRHTNNSEYARVANEHLDKLSAFYRREYPPAENPIFQVVIGMPADSQR